MKTLTTLVIAIMTFLCVPMNSTATPINLSISGTINTTFGNAAGLFTIGTKIHLFDVIFDDESLVYTSYNADGSIKKEVSIDPLYTSAHTVEYFLTGHSMMSDATFTLGAQLQSFVDSYPTELSTNGYTDNVLYVGSEAGGTHTYTTMYSAGLGHILSTGFPGPDYTGTSNGVGSLILVENPGNPNRVTWTMPVVEVITQGSPVPEPATMFLLGFGLLGIAGVNRRKKIF